MKIQGKAAGAGIAGHIHMARLAAMGADANFLCRRVRDAILSGDVG